MSSIKDKWYGKSIQLKQRTGRNPEPDVFFERRKHLRNAQKGHFGFLCSKSGRGTQQDVGKRQPQWREDWKFQEFASKDGV